MTNPVSTVSRLRSVTSWALFLSSIALAVSGFLPAFVFRQAVGGYWLMVHVAAGGVFALGLAGVSVMEAHRNRFAPGMIGLLPAVRKACFWVVLVLALVMLLSVAAIMFQLFGSRGQERLMEIHRYGAVVIAIVGAIYAYLAFAHARRFRSRVQPVAAKSTGSEKMSGTSMQ